jgi:hypothetical protein
MRIPFRRKPTRLERLRSVWDRFAPDFDDEEEDEDYDYDDEDEDEDEDDDDEEDDYEYEDEDEEDEEDEEIEFALPGLHWLAAGLFIAAGTESALERSDEDRANEVVRWAPMVTGPLAAAAHAARAMHPTHTTRLITNIADGIAIGVGAAGLASNLYHVANEEHEPAELRTWQDQLPSFGPVAFAAIGVLGMMLLEEEEETGQREDALEKRARLIERFVPQRKAKVDRIVVHV